MVFIKEKGVDVDSRIVRQLYPSVNHFYKDVRFFERHDLVEEKKSLFGDQQKKWTLAIDCWVVADILQRIISSIRPPFRPKRP